MPKSEYKTKQRELICQMFKKNPDGQFSPSDAAGILDGKIGKSTVYREISRLCEDGFLRRYTDSSGNTMYQLSMDGCDSHFHLRCTDCGRIIHLDCGVMSDICTHIQSHHGFSIDISKTILYGKCNDCNK